MPKFPKTLYAKYEDGGSGPDYIGTYDDPVYAAEMGEKIAVGVYELIETVSVKGVAVTDTLSTPRRRKSK